MLVGVIAAVAATSMAFNLVCTGTEQHKDMINFLRPGGHEESSSNPFREVYRIDLREGRWCSGSCETTTRLLDVSRAMITFEHGTWADRETGFYHAETSGMQNENDFDEMKRNGTCMRAPFSGFPKQRF